MKRAAWIWSTMMQELKVRLGPAGKRVMLKEGRRKEEQVDAGPSVTSAGKRLSFKKNLKIHISGLSSQPRA